jgi:electron transfer flavoprotein beta subunit
MADPRPAKGPGPLVVACLRHADPRPAADLLTGEITQQPAAATAAAAEFAALELALRAAGAWQGRVLAVCAGPRAAEATLAEALAVGAEALRVEWPGPGEQAGDLAEDEHALAVALAGAIRAAGPALVVCGDRSAGRGTGALPAFLAHELGAAQALGLVHAEVDGGALAGLRRLPGGRRERVRVAAPAVCSVEAAGVRLRRAPLPAVLAARRAAIGVVAPAAAARVSMVRLGPPRPYLPRTHLAPAAPAGSAQQRLLALSGVLTRRETATVIGPVGPARAARELLAYLDRAGVVPAGVVPAGAIPAGAAPADPAAGDGAARDGAARDGAAGDGAAGDGAAGDGAAGGGAP